MIKPARLDTPTRQRNIAIQYLADLLPTSMRELVVQGNEERKNRGTYKRGDWQDLAAEACAAALASEIERKAAPLIRDDDRG